MWKEAASSAESNSFYELREANNSAWEWSGMLERSEVG